MDHGPALPLEIIIFLGAAVIAPPLFNRLGLGAIVGYLVAGILLGPSGIGVFKDAEATLRIAELGVVLLLFLIGLELELSRLLDMKRDIIGLGVAQLVITTTALSGAGYLTGFGLGAAVAVGFALSLSSTAVATRILDERGHLPRSYGRRTFSILLAQDLAIVPAFALIPALANGEKFADPSSIAIKVGAALFMLAAIVVAGRFLIDPILRFIARNGGHEGMIAAALLLVFGAAIGSEAVGLSMALGAFLAGLLLAESSYRHELEINVAPFRSLLLALFFIGVGMSLNVRVVADAWPYLGLALIGLIAIKMAVVGGVTRLSGSSNPDALRVASLLAPASEFAFVLLPLVVATGLIHTDVGQLLGALCVLSMIVGPPLIAGMERIARKLPRPDQYKGIDHATDLDGTGRTALVVGFGRFGQMAAQFLLTEGVETTLIDRDSDGIRTAARFGFKVHYGDGTRVDVLRAAGASEARVILVCIENPELSLKVVDLVKQHFPLAKVLVRSFDRAHSLALMDKNIDFEIRETFESSMKFGHAALRALGFSEDRVAAVEIDVRRRDVARFELQRARGPEAGTDLLHQTQLQSEPLLQAEHTAIVLNPDAAEVIGDLAKKAG